VLQNLQPVYFMDWWRDSVQFLKTRRAANFKKDCDWQRIFPDTVTIVHLYC